MGQDAALAVLRAAVDNAVRGRGGLVPVAGGAGIGKTAVVSDELGRLLGEHVALAVAALQC